MPTSNTDMNTMMRSRRAEMEKIPGDDTYEGPTETESPSEDAAEFTVAAPGEPSTGEQFEYEPLPDRPGAWAVYPPGVPCDDTVYRVQMDAPAGEGDFDGMQKALDDAGATDVEPASDAGVGEDEY